MDKFEHKIVDAKWQKIWTEKQTYRVNDASLSSKKMYVLDMFPYPSGEGLHVGHPKGYIATDIFSRLKRMQGYNVLHPMGWDAFGLPAENYALKHKVHPRTAVEKNIAHFKQQLEHIGFDYDWNREINTTDPEYYKWTQWIFLQLFKKGLAYQSNEPINWCPSCMTGLANEDLAGAECERCGATVEKRALPQWVLKITTYADRLLADLDGLKWPEHIKEAQRNWIGRSEGALIKFQVSGDSGQDIEVFTTRPDTLFGATYVVLAPEHPAIKNLESRISNLENVRAYIDESKKRTEIERLDATQEKTGVRLEGVMAINPATKQEIPIYVADYVIAGYGTGAIMAVPAHDERDYAFAIKFGLPINQVVAPHHIDESSPPRSDKKNTQRKIVHALVLDPSGKKIIALRHKTQPWLTPVTGGIEEGEDTRVAAEREIREETGYQNLKFIRELPYLIRAEFYAAHKDVNRDVLSRGLVFQLTDLEQRPLSDEESAKHTIEWLPITDAGMFRPVAELEHLIPALYGDVGPYTGSGTLINSGEFDGRNSNEVQKDIVVSVGGQLATTYKIKDWVFSRQRYWGEPIPIIHCAKDGAVAVPDDQLPVLLPEVDSYEPSGTGESPLATISEWVNTACPTCGGPAKRETNTMPQWAGSSWYYLRFMDPKNSDMLVSPDAEKYWAPVDVYVGGDHAVRHLIYARFWHKFLYDIGVVSTIEPFARLEFLGFILAEDGRKMSKRYGNVINPDDVVDQYGADAFRLYEMFMGPFEGTTPWSASGIIGIRRWLDRVWRLQTRIKNDELRITNDSERVLHETVQKVTEDIEAFHFNTAVSQLMILTNTLEKQAAIDRSVWKTFLRLLAPFAPHITNELWELAQLEGSIDHDGWPEPDSSKLVRQTVTLAIQVNGRLRGQVEMAQSSPESEIITAASTVPEVARHLEGRAIKKTIIVPGRIVNFVI